MILFFKINKLTQDSYFDNGLDQDPLAEHDRLIVAFRHWWQGDT